MTTPTNLMAVRNWPILGVDSITIAALPCCLDCQEYLLIQVFNIQGVDREETGLFADVMSRQAGESDPVKNSSNW
jgi:hypothetical protein